MKACMPAGDAQPSWKASLRKDWNVSTSTVEQKYLERGVKHSAARQRKSLMGLICQLGACCDWAS